jgi:hypothetical protein
MAGLSSVCISGWYDILSTVAQAEIANVVDKIIYFRILIGLFSAGFVLVSDSLIKRLPPKSI